MKIKILEPVVVVCGAGSVVEVTEEQCAILIKNGKAEAVKEVKKK